ncbi:TonB-dependent receptor [Methylophilus aquaticus]|uniref:TonB-dependent receptor n=1 Tax=Methylophilus aquaticus TaxID=1971610 RepID=UPI002795894D|nr:TonB-dependent receptor [Methylophilus aquaticus]
MKLPDVVVSADFRPSTAQKTAVSLTEVKRETIEARGAQHLEEVLNLAPNVNISAGASRGRFFQIRGMGILSQYDNPVNPSVGLIIDGIDFSRLGGAATLFDIDSVEVLQGPQGTKLGPNAIAGAITMRSAEPTKEFKMRAQAGLGEYNTRNLGVAVGGTIVEDQLLGRASIYTHKSDGYMQNDTLGRDDTQKQDELTFRSKFKLFATEDLTLDFTLMHVNVNNGYDAFTLDNSRHSQSNQPGVDTQNTNAFAVKANWQASDAVIIQSEASYLNSSSTYSFDGDWRTENDFEKHNRDRDNYSFELRALSDKAGRIFNDSTDWTIGVYRFVQDEKFNSRVDYRSFGPDELTQLTGTYKTENTAVFGQLDSHLTEKLILVSGLRVEDFNANYADTGFVRATPSNVKKNVSEVLLGAKLGLNYQAQANQLIYTSLTRGYKPGGINNNATLPQNQRQFNTEYMWNFETGFKSSWLDGTLVTNLAAFYAKRLDAQTQSSAQISGTGNFVEFYDNAARATHQGVEASMDWFVTDQFRMLGSLGLLDAKFDSYQNPDSTAYNPQGRQVAHAPRYTFNLGTEYYTNEKWTLRANVEGKDAFYFSDSNSAKSNGYALLNASADYQYDKHWKVRVWARNILDKDYATRGFFFANNPANGFLVDEKYIQYGEPRVAGVTVTYDY